jgi:adenylate cyclase
MFQRLRTVRAKLTALVSLSAVVMLAALPVLSWLLHRQLVDEVGNRVADAEHAFQTELDDAIADLTLASRVIADDAETVRAVGHHEAAAARHLAEIFVSVYPNVDVLLVGGGGEVVAQVGVDRPPDNVSAIAELGGLAAGKRVSTVIEHGCESPGSDAPPAYAIGVAIPGGSVVVCLPLGRPVLENASTKLGMQLALVVVNARNERLVVGETRRFPVLALTVRGRETKIVDVGGRSWALAHFDPRQVAGRLGQVRVVAAMDVTDVHAIVRRNLLYALAVLAVAGGVSITVGSRLASVLSNALKRVNFALKRVEELDYVHVEPVHTGDELEALASGFNRMVDGLKERDKLRTTFGKYMTATVMEHLLAGKVALGGESLRVTVLFSDIRGFTSISERMDPQNLVALLNEYFTEMVTIVMDEGGVVDKYIGDAIMVVFGAPVPKPGDAVNAVRAAVRMRRALHDLNDRLVARGLPALRTGIGIHTGDVVAGNIGSERRMEYTVIGDAVNLASRLESSTKELGVNVLISQDTYDATEAAIEARPVRELTVKGRAQPVMTYEVLGLVGGPPLEPGKGSLGAEAGARPA